MGNTKRNSKAVNLQRFVNTLAMGHKVLLERSSMKLVATEKQIHLDLHFLHGSDYEDGIVRFKAILELCLLPVLAARGLGLSPPIFYMTDNRWMVVGDDEKTDRLEREAMRRATSEEQLKFSFAWEENKPQEIYCYQIEFLIIALH